MDRIIFNHSVIAFPGKINTDAVTVPIIPFETFATQYGLFIPTTSSGYTFLRWVQKGCGVGLIGVEIIGDLLHVSNTGEVFVVCVDTIDNVIKMYPYVTDKISYISSDRGFNEAYSYLFQKRELSLSGAIKLLAEGSKAGFYKPIIISVEDWVKHAKAKGFVKTFFRNKIRHSRPSNK